MASDKWTWYGHAGHLCAAYNCRFHLCTKVGGYLVSTVGDYFERGIRNTVGAYKDSFFETFVFNVLPGSSCSDLACLCGLPNVDWVNIEGVRCATAGEASKTHMRMCKKYDRRKS